MRDWTVEVFGGVLGDQLILSPLHHSFIYPSGNPETPGFSAIVAGILKPQRQMAVRWKHEIPSQDGRLTNGFSGGLLDVNI